MNRLGKLFVAAAVIAVPAACKDETRKAADQAAENVQDQREDLREQAEDVTEAIGDLDAKEVREQVKEMAGAAGDVQVADYEFDVKRRDRITQLRAVHSVIAAQPILINALSPQIALTDKARADLADKMQVFHMRLDEAGHAIESLQTTDANNFQTQNDAAVRAMDRLDDARDAAWEALNDGDRLEPS